ncbi:uncharacterized protein LOC114121665 [Aphis gossypii]|uniref:uncharacterized protein LOC114121665 n=1 Tax=Aphis gossypii TaxID=80765 RepID=UPI002158E200|nr:uncharacterized protein LOC114121665 [Aphis gossypii]
MTDSIVNSSTMYKKTFKNIPPTPLTELIESTNYTLNFTKRKFLHIGIDPADMFRVAVHIITPTRYVNISIEFLKRIFSLMGNILSFILEQPGKYKRTIFIETDKFKLSSMMYTGENVLVIESKTDEGCRILLNRMELIRLHYLEWCIFETIVRKSTIMHPIVLKQFNIFTNYINGELSKAESLPRTSEEMTTFIKNVRDDHIIASSPKHDVNFISQLKMYALAQLTEHCMQRWNGEMSPKPFDGNLTIISPTSPTYLPSSITKVDIFDIHDEKVNNVKPYDSFDGMLSLDENDGPDFFNVRTVSDANHATYAMFPRPL